MLLYIKIKNYGNFFTKQHFFPNSNPKAKTTLEPKKGCSNVKDGCFNKIKPIQNKEKLQQSCE